MVDRVHSIEEGFAVEMLEQFQEWIVGSLFVLALSRIWVWLCVGLGREIEDEQILQRVQRVLVEDEDQDLEAVGQASSSDLNDWLGDCGGVWDGIEC